MNKYYKSLVFTDHALERLGKRSITQEMVYQVLSNPYKSYPNEQSTKFIKNVNGRKVHVVGQFLKEENKWLIISVWVRGEDDQLPIAWRIITFPFWLLWKLLSWLFKILFNAKSA